MFDKKARQVAMVAADHCDYDWFWATTHAPNRQAALHAILGREWRQYLEFSSSQGPTSQGPERRQDAFPQRNETCKKAFSTGMYRTAAPFGHSTIP